MLRAFLTDSLSLGCLHSTFLVVSNESLAELTKVSYDHPRLSFSKHAYHVGPLKLAAFNKHQTYSVKAFLISTLIRIKSRSLTQIIFFYEIFAFVFWCLHSWYNNKGMKAKQKIHHLELNVWRFHWIIYNEWTSCWLCSIVLLLYCLFKD